MPRVIQFGETMEIRWLLLFVASAAAFPANQTEMNEKPKSSGVTDDFYEMLLRYVADNAFKKPTVDYYSEVASKSDRNQYEDLHYDQQPVMTQVDEAESKNEAANNFYYSYPARKPGQQPSHQYGHKGKDKDVLWEIVETLFGKKKFKFEEALFEWLSDGHHKGQPSSYGRPSYVGSDAYAPSKADVFTKVKLLAIAATALLIVLGGLILLAPLIVGKTKGRAFHQLSDRPELAEVTQRVLHAIENYEYNQAQ